MIKLILTGVLILVSACSFKKKDENLSGPVQVQVPFVVNGKYNLHILELLTVTDLTKLSGGAARFLMDPDSGSGVLRGRAPNFRYIRNDDGVVIPTDDLSLQLATVYAHMERLQQLDKLAGAEGVLEYPRTVAINTQIKKQDGTLDEDNAMYSGKFDAMLMVPYSQSALPIMANGGVLAHEHFHALFQRLVATPLAGKYSEYQPDMELHAKYHTVLLRGFNEGLADVWGWVYSGDTNFVQRSLPQNKGERDLNAKDILANVKSSVELQAQISHIIDPQALIAHAYVIGHDTARVIKTFATFYKNRKDISELEARLLTGQFVLKALPVLKEKFLNLKTDEFLTTMEALDAFSANVPDMTMEECSYIAKRAGLGDANSKREASCKKLP